MSAEATIAVFNHAQGSDVQKWTLGVLANSASHDGVIAIGRGELARRLGKTEKAAGQILGKLRESGQLMLLEDGGGRGKTNVYWLNLPGIEEPELRRLADKKGGIEDPPAAPAPPSPDGPPRPGKKSSSSEAAFVEALRDAEVPDEMLADAKALLQKGKKVGGQLVTPEELACAAAGLAAFNELYEWDGRQGANFGIGAAVTSIVQRARERPSWDPATHVRLVASAWRLRWWEKTDNPRRPTPNVIWGPKAFEQVVQDAEDEKAGRKSGERRYTRRSR
jgi:hypothetical protein